MASWWSRAKESFRKQAGAEKTRVEKHFEKKAAPETPSQMIARVSPKPSPTTKKITISKATVKAAVRKVGSVLRKSTVQSAVRRGETIGELRKKGYTVGEITEAAKAEAAKPTPEEAAKKIGAKLAKTKVGKAVKTAKEIMYGLKTIEAERFGEKAEKISAPVRRFIVPPKGKIYTDTESYKKIQEEWAKHPEKKPVSIYAQKSSVNRRNKERTCKKDRRSSRIC